MGTTTAIEMPAFAPVESPPVLCRLTADDGSVGSELAAVAEFDIMAGSATDELACVVNGEKAGKSWEGTSILRVWVVDNEVVVIDEPAGEVAVVTDWVAVDAEAFNAVGVVLVANASPVAPVTQVYMPCRADALSGHISSRY